MNALRWWLCSANDGCLPMRWWLTVVCNVERCRCVAGCLAMKEGLCRGNDIAADEGVTMLEVGEDGRDERLDDLRLIEAAEETEGDTADVLVGVLEVVAEVLVDPGELCLKRVNEENRTWEQNVGGAA